MQRRCKAMAAMLATALGWASLMLLALLLAPVAMILTSLGVDIDGAANRMSGLEG